MIVLGFSSFFFKLELFIVVVVVVAVVKGLSGFQRLFFSGGDSGI